jgi:uncharacterized membrane protein YgdD (TMEM256/DUF423 family)
MQNKLRPHSLLSAASFLLAVSIVLGALAAHALKSTLEPTHFNTFQVGVHYHQLQSLGLLILGIFLYFKPNFFPKFKWPLILHFLGLFFFSGNCYLYSLTQIKFFVHLVPIGGVMMIIAWFWTAFCWSEEF